MRILCYGDSNTWGYDPRSYFGSRYDPDSRWPELLAAQTGFAVVNRGENGRSISRPLFHTSENADLFLVMLGTNDLLQGLSAQETAAWMDVFLKHVSAFYPRVLLIAPPPMKRGEWVDTDALVLESIRLAEEYSLLAQKHCIPFVDTRSWNIPLTFDGVHFTEEGHRIFTKRILDYIRTL